MSKKERNTQDVEINIVPVLKAVLSKLWIMVLVGVIIGAGTYFATKIFVKPTYRSGFTAYVNNKQALDNNTGLTYSDLNASRQLTESYKLILKSERILTAAAESIGMKIPSGKMKRMVSAETQSGTEVISVYVVDEDPQVAYTLATALAETAPKFMAEIVEGSSMKIIDYPVYSNNRYRPSYIKYGLLGFLAGFLIVLIIVLIKYFKDDTVKVETELEQRYPFPILGVIPDVTRASGHKSDYYYYESSSKTNEEDKRSKNRHEK